MASPLTFGAWAESLEQLNHYDVLRIPMSADATEIQKAFHDLSLRCHPDRFVEEGEDVTRAATAVFKKLVEAYNVLRRPALRTRYDEELKKLSAERRHEAVAFDEHAVVAPKSFAQRTLTMIARTPRAKQEAARADRFLSNGRLEEARVCLVTAVQHDPGNAELEERLSILYEALALEPF